MLLESVSPVDPALELEQHLPIEQAQVEHKKTYRFQFFFLLSDSVVKSLQGRVSTVLDFFIEILAKIRNILFAKKTEEAVVSLDPDALLCLFFEDLNYGSTAEEIRQKIVSNHDRRDDLIILQCMDKNISSIPPEIFRIPLQTINFSGNKFSTIPYELVTLSDTLTELNFSDNKFREIPSYISHFTKLDTLDFTKNQLRFLPPELKELHALESLSLPENQLEELPDFFDKFPGLSVIKLDKNKLTKLPATIWKSTSLKRLYCSENRLSRIETHDMNIVRELAQVNLSRNKITELPDWFTTCGQLEYLNVSWNQIRKLPQNFGDLTSLTSLSLAHNRVRELPDSFSQLPNLSILNISENPIEKFPEVLSQIKQLRRIILDKKQLTRWRDSLVLLKAQKHWITFFSSEDITQEYILP